MGTDLAAGPEHCGTPWPSQKDALKKAEAEREAKADAELAKAEAKKQAAIEKAEQAAAQRKLLAEVERQRGLRQRKGTSPSPPVLLAGNRVPSRAQTKLLYAVCPAQPAPAMHR